MSYITHRPARPATKAKDKAMYNIIDRHTGCIVGQAKTLAGARRAVDRRDNAYGAYRYTFRAA